MTKEIYYDLHFTDSQIIILSDAGRAFVDRILKTGDLDHAAIYQAAIKEGLHIQFATAAIRDSIAAVSA
jgi:hypothetical protein